MKFDCNCNFNFTKLANLCLQSFIHWNSCSLLLIIQNWWKMCTSNNIFRLRSSVYVIQLHYSVVMVLTFILLLHITFVFPCLLSLRQGLDFKFSYVCLKKNEKKNTKPNELIMITKLITAVHEISFKLI